MREVTLEMVENETWSAQELAMLNANSPADLVGDMVDDEGRLYFGEELHPHYFRVPAWGR